MFITGATSLKKRVIRVYSHKANLYPQRRTDNIQCNLHIIIQKSISLLDIKQ